MLQSIDELWMLHIDSMTKLREEVAFEWYAQKQRGVGYKERAFVKFEDLISTIEYKITKGIFSINAITTPEPQKISDINIENDDEITWLLDWLLEEEKSKQNPLFATPSKAKVKVIKKEDMLKIASKKKKIRV